MTKWSNDLKKDLKKITLSSTMKQKIIQQQPKKLKNATLIPTFISIMLFATMFLFLYNTNFTIQKSATVIQEDMFSELYIERQINANVSMHRSSMYSGIANIDAQGIANFQNYWDNKQLVNKDTNDFDERQFIAYKDNGEKIAGLLFEEGETVYLALNDLVYELPTTTSNYMHELDFRSYDAKILLLYILFFVSMLYYDSRYAQEGKKQRLLNAVVIFTSVIMLNFNVYVPILFFVFIIYSILYYYFRGEVKQRYESLNKLNYLFTLASLVLVVINYYFLEANLSTLISILVAFSLVNIYSSQMEKRLEPPKCSNCEQTISFKDLYMSYFTTKHHCIYCETPLLANKKRFKWIVIIYIIFTAVVLAVAVMYLEVGIIISVLIACLMIAQAIIVTIATLPLKKSNKTHQ